MMESSVSFKDIPSNCRELQLLGHTNNGIFLVKGLDSKALKIETVYCDFKRKTFLQYSGMVTVLFFL